MEVEFALFMAVAPTRQGEHLQGINRAIIGSSVFHNETFLGGIVPLFFAEYPCF